MNDKIRQTKKTLENLSGKKIEGDFDTLSQLYNAFNEDCEANGAPGGGGGGDSSWNDLADKPIMIIDLTFLEGGNDETGEYPVALSKSFDEIQTAYENGVALFVRDGILYQVTRLNNIHLTCAGLWIDSTGAQSRMRTIELMYKQDGTWVAIPLAPILYEPEIEYLILYSRNRRWNIEVDDNGQVVATEYRDT